MSDPTDPLDPRLKIRSMLAALLSRPVLLALLGAVLIWNFQNPIVDFLTLDHTRQARVAISVSTPTVHTRERLLNDRFEQVEWLGKQLEQTRPDKAEAKATGTPIEAKPEQTTATPTKEKTGTQIDLMSELVEQIRYGQDDPRKPFEMMNGFRDVIRAERARAMLDDRHDMDDNTLDLFSFDTTVMPREGMRGSAVIEVLITPEPSELLIEAAGRKEAIDRMRDQQVKDLFDTYVGWLEKVRDVQQSSLETLTRTLDTVDISADRTAYELFLRRSACSELLRRSATYTSTSVDARKQACRAAARGTSPWDRLENEPNAPAADDAAVRVVQDLDLATKRIRENIIVSGATVYLAGVSAWQSVAKGEIGRNPNSSSILSSLAKIKLRTAQDISKECLEKLVTSPDQTVAAVDRSVLGQIANIYPEMAKGIVFDCNASKNLPLRILWEIVERLGPGRPAPVMMPSDPPASGMQGNPEVQIASGVSIAPADIRRVQTSCVAAMLLEESIVRPTTEQLRNHGASLKEFFDLSVDQLATGCTMSVRPKVFSIRLPSPMPTDDNEKKRIEQSLKDQIDQLRRMGRLLEGPTYTNGQSGPITSAYGYSLSPRLRQNVELRQDRRDSASTDTAASRTAISRRRGIDYRGVEPEIVGFSRPKSQKATERGARFGWLLTPRPGKDATWSVPLEQAILSAVVAVPSWWRSTFLQVCTRFVAQADTGSVLSDEFWQMEKRCRVEMIRLPGSAADISRHLGMDVLTTPYVEAWNAPPELIAGAQAEASQLVITGERLWRNTVVTLGGQKADRIEVLPDMVGISATFSCIRKPTIGVVDQPPTVAPPDTTSNAKAGADRAGQPPASPDRSAQKPPANPDRAGPAGAAAPSTPVDAAAAKAPPALIYSVPVIVWTSEGHTREQLVHVTVNNSTWKRCPDPPNISLSPQ